MVGRSDRAWQGLIMATHLIVLQPSSLHESTEELIFDPVDGCRPPNFDVPL